MTKVFSNDNETDATQIEMNFIQKNRKRGLKWWNVLKLEQKKN